MRYQETRRRFAARVDARSIRMALKFNNWSYGDLARAAGVSRSTVGNLTGGIRETANPETIAKVA
jgi:transcriptional regulator with XRE-family HTH domain